MIRHKRWTARDTAAALAVLLAAGALLSACGTDKPPADPAPEAKAGGGMQNGKFDPPVTITTAFIVGSNVKFKEGETIENNVHTKYVLEQMGIQMKTLWTVGKADAYETKVRLALTSGEPLPDVITLSNANLIDELIDAGKVMDIKEAFEKYASPLMKERYAEYPDIFNPVKRGDKVYGLPKGASNDSPVMWIRQDWLDKLGLKPPTTMDELDVVLDAFVNRDPDGNGKKDTYGITFALKDDIVNTRGDTSFIFGAFGNAIPTYWTRDPNGGLLYGSIQPSVKAGLGKMAEWFGKGYMDPEVAVYDGAKVEEVYGHGKIGIFPAAGTMANTVIKTSMEKIPGAVYKPYHFPTGPNGQRASAGGRDSGPIVLLSKDFKHPDAFFHLYSQIFNFGVTTNPNDHFYYRGHEGYDYKMVDGKPEYDRSANAIVTRPYVITGQYPEFYNELPTMKKLLEGKPWSEPLDYTFGSLPKERWMAGIIENEAEEYAVANMFRTVPTATMKSKGELLNKMEKETFIKIIYGKEPVDAFDKFVNDWQAGGGNDIINEVNEWYRSIGGK